MDTFFEQIVTIKKTAKTWVCFVGIAVLAILLMTFVLWMLGGLGFAIAVGIVYCAYKLYAMLFIEYEYIITNSTLDIDKIIAKSSRKRVSSFELSAIKRIEKFNSQISLTNYKNKIIACNIDDSNAYLMVIEDKTNGEQVILFSPDERIKQGMTKFLPRHLLDIFND